MVLLHGLSGSFRWWRYTVPELAFRYRVHVPELVGFGRSLCEGAQPSIAELAELMAEWLDAMGLQRPALIGHSMGGQVAIHLAADRSRSVERLVLVAATGIPRPLTVYRLTRLAARLVPPRCWGTPRFLPTMAADVLRTGPRVLWQSARRLLEDDVRPLLPSILAPTLLVWGEFDPLVPLAQGRELAEAIPGAQLRVIQGGAHNVMADRPGAFNRELLHFLGDNGDIGGERGGDGSEE